MQIKCGREQILTQVSVAAKPVSFPLKNAASFPVYQQSLSETTCDQFLAFQPPPRPQKIKKPWLLVRGHQASNGSSPSDKPDSHFQVVGLGPVNLAQQLF